MDLLQELYPYLRKIVLTDEEEKDLQSILNKFEKEHPSIECRLQKLGFKKTCSRENPGFITPGYLDIYEREDGIKLKVYSVPGVMAVLYKDNMRLDSPIFNTESINERNDEFIQWIEESLSQI